MQSVDPVSALLVEIPVSMTGPGMYSVMVIVDAGPFSAELGPSIVGREIWVQADDGGLHLRDHFDPSFLPAGIVRRAGAYSSLERSGGASPAASFGSEWATETGMLVYINDSSAVIGAPGVEIHLDVWDNYESKYVASYGYGATQAGGAFEIDCPPSAFERYDYSFTLRGVYADVVSPYHTAWSESLSYGSCGGDVGNVVANSSPAARIFVAMNTIAPASQTYFGQARGHINVAYDPSGTTSGYTPSTDSLTIVGGSVWGVSGRFSQSHEYGHALHEKGLGGLAPFDAGCTVHNFNTTETYQCAWNEGFADFHGIMVYGVGLQNYESHSFYENPCCGPSKEGGVLGLLWDLVDSSSWPNSTSESWDNAAYPGTYIAALVKTCLVTDNGSAWYHIRGVDHFVYCAEQQVDPDVTGSATYFSERNPDPISETEAASEPSGSPPGGWSLAAVRAAWLWNLYGEP